MNEIPPSIPCADPAAPAYKDRSTGLAIFGILTLLLGCLAGLFVPLMLFSQMAAARANPGAGNLAAMLPAMVVYGLLAVALIWLGIGSVQTRRWARALLLIFSWAWLVMGIFAITGMALVMPRMLENVTTAGVSNGTANQALPPGALTGIMVVMLLFLGVFFIVLPAIWIFFYSSRHVKATCEARDGVARWTDACPLPVLGLCVWLWFSVPMMLVMPLIGHVAVPFFGRFVTGLPGALLYLVLAALWSYVAWLIYQLKPAGWWLLLGGMAVLTVSSGLTFAQHDVLEMYQLMGYPSAQMEQMQKTGLLSGHLIDWLMGFCMLPMLGYILFVKKYFRNNGHPKF
jgi:hypothetical protein